MKHLNSTSKRIGILFLFLCISLVFAANGFATQITKYDYGDAPGYATARNNTGEWQRLGSKWDSEKWARNVDWSDDGVDWSVDGGLTWGHDTLTVGESVTFRFDFTRASYGSHQYDTLKAWIDWNQDGFWDNGAEEIIAEQWFKNTDAGIYEKYFYATLDVPDYALVGDTWLRARVTCDHTSFANVNPYNDLWQGETEDWKVNVAAVPEPATMLLMGFGMTGLGFVRRLRRR